ncbi:Cytochrome P450 [Corchorus olitorius]|uniref:Cytochrome P450 n=1 Tax=Corchorus olitorius TaxID=93759 RepID=A0A1R3HJP7_9ROSI|nr:Cytochrome P450 [Corchorus olitorius]
MEVACSFFNITLCFFIFLFPFIIKSIIAKHRSPRNFPPSPPAFPIIGHLHLLKEPVHRRLHQLSEKYGPILYLKFGTRKVLIVFSASGAEECFTKNDIIFANRPQRLAGKHLNYNNATIGSANYGDYWRNLRRLTTLELFSTSRLNMFATIRQDEVQLLLKELFVASGREPAKVHVTSKLIDLAFNMILRMIAGKRYYGKDVVDEEANQFRDIIREFVEIDISTNLMDFLPVLQWVDFLGVEKRMKRIMKKLDRFLQSLLEEHRKTGEDSISRGRKPTLIDVILSLHQTEPEFYTDQTIKAVVLRDPKLWVDSTRFMPERFEGGESEGYNYKLLPFGVGRRACPAAALGRRVVGLVLGSLIQCFEWNRIGNEEIDMKEGTGLAMPKAEPLVALCNPRADMINLLSTL